MLEVHISSLGIIRLESRCMYVDAFPLRTVKYCDANLYKHTALWSQLCLESEYHSFSAKCQTLNNYLGKLMAAVVKKL